MAKNSIGLIELGSIAAGFEVADSMLKTADVELLLSRSICSGKYMVMVRASDAAVKAANVRLIELRLAMALGGKAFVTLTGSVAAVGSAIEAGARTIAQK